MNHDGKDGFQADEMGCGSVNYLCNLLSTKERVGSRDSKEKDLLVPVRKICTT